MLGPLKTNNPQYLQLGEGLLLAGIALDDVLAGGSPLTALAEAAEDPARCLGATASGCVFQCLPEVLHTEARGQRTPAAGTLIEGAVRATLSGTLLSVTPQNAARLLSLSAPEDGAHRVLEGVVGRVLSAAADSLCWVGTLGGGLLAIEMHAPVSIGGISFRPGRTGTGEMPFTFLAQQRGPEDHALPCRLHWLKEADA